MTPSLPSRIDRYEIVNRLGKGGMGEVYLAKDPSLGRTVAIKMLTEDNDELRERFAREARSAAALNHKNIVTIYDVGEDSGRPFIAMEFLDGETMAEMIRRRAPLSTTRRLELMIELCTGLGYAHRSGIVHRDIKPANLMITNEGTLKILDFGIARLTADATSSGLTRIGTVMGSLHYMSPEQAEGLSVDERSDIFSVGSVLYEVLSSVRAFPGDMSHLVLNAVLSKDPRPIRELLPDIDSELERIVVKGLKKSPADRYQKLSELAADLSRVREYFENSGEKTVVIARGPQGQRDRPSGGVETPSAGRKRIPNLQEIADRRSALIESHLKDAAEHLEAGRYQDAIEQCEKAVVLNPDDMRAVELLDQAHRGREGVQVQQWLDEARALASDGALTGAERLVGQSLQLQPESPEALAIELDLKERRRERERAAEQARAVRAAVARTRANMEAGAFEAALRSAAEALAFDPSDDEASQLMKEARAAIDERERQLSHERRASEAVALARERAAAEDFEGALAELLAFAPSHAIVTTAIAEIQHAAAALEQQRRLAREAEDRRRAAESEAQQEQRRQAREAEERRRAAEAEALQQEQARAREAEERRRAAEAEALQQQQARAQAAEAEEKRQRAEQQRRQEREAEERRRAAEAEALQQQQARARQLENEQAEQNKTVLLRRDAEPEDEGKTVISEASGKTTIRPVGAPKRPVSKPWHQKPFVLWPAAALILITASVVFWPRNPPPPPPQVNYGEILANARRLTDPVAAIGQLLAIPATASEYRDARALLGRIRSTEADHARTSQKTAEAAGKTSEAAYGEGTRQLAQADALTDLKDVESAVKLYGAARQLFDQAATAGESAADLVGRANSEQRAGRTPQAVDYAVRALSLQPAFEPALRFLSERKAEGRRPAKAAQEAAEAAGASRLNDFKVASANVAQADGLLPPRTNEALDLYRQAVSRFAAATNQATGAAQNQLQVRNAEQAVNRALEQGNATEARARLEDLRKLSPANPAFAGLEKRVKAAEALAEANELVRRAAGTTNVNDAVNWLTRAYDLNPTPAIKNELDRRRAELDKLKPTPTATPLPPTPQPTPTPTGAPSSPEQLIQAALVKWIEDNHGPNSDVPWSQAEPARLTSVTATSAVAQWRVTAHDKNAQGVRQNDKRIYEFSLQRSAQGWTVSNFRFLRTW